MSTKLTERDKKKQKQGRGQGEGHDYTPHIYTQEARLNSNSERPIGITTGRVHHLLSRLEAMVFVVYDWSPDVVNIREQYPLDQAITLRIAERLGIPHPTYPKTKPKQPIVMTSDFVLDVQREGDKKPSLHVRSVKPARRLYEPRTVAKLEIERVYWEMKGASWKIVTNKDIPRTFVWNLENLYRYVSIGKRPITDEQIVAIRAKFNERFCPSGIVLNRVALTIDDAFGIKRGTSIFVAKHLIATRQWQVDLFQQRLVPGATVQIVDLGG